MITVIDILWIIITYAIIPGILFNLVDELNEHFENSNVSRSVYALVILLKIFSWGYVPAITIVRFLL